MTSTNKYEFQTVVTIPLTVEELDNQSINAKAFRCCSGGHVSRWYRGLGKRRQRRARWQFESDFELI